MKPKPITRFVVGTFARIHTVMWIAAYIVGALFFVVFAWIPREIADRLAMWRDVPSPLDEFFGSNRDDTY